METLIGNVPSNKVKPTFKSPLVSDPDQTSNLTERILPKSAQRVRLIGTEQKRQNNELSPKVLSPTTQNNILNNNYVWKGEKGQTETISGGFYELPFGVSRVSAKLVEHLTSSLQNEAHIQEVLSNDPPAHHWQQTCIQLKLRNEKLEAKIQALEAENEVLKMNLKGTKDRCDSLCEKMGKLESNDTALRLLLKYRLVLSIKYSNRIQVRRKNMRVVTCEG